jgi:hypothetical protein
VETPAAVLWGAAMGSLLRLVCGRLLL